SPRASRRAGNALSSMIRIMLDKNASCCATANPSNDRALPQIGRDAVKFNRPYASAIRRAGDTRAQHEANAKQGLRPMSILRSEKTESAEGEVDTNLAAVTEVEAGIRDFVRNDIAYLRRPATLNTSTEPALDGSAEATVNNVNSLIQRV